MNISASALSPLFRSDVQAEIMARLFLGARDDRYTTADLSRLVGASYTTTHREVQRLIDSGLVDETVIGRNKMLAPNRDSRVYGPLVELLTIGYGASVIIPRELQNVAGIDAAYIYGSWAERRAGVAGSAPRDIDVLLVGNPARGAVAAAARAAERSLGNDVNIRTVSKQRWNDHADDPFLTTVRSRPLYELELELEPAVR